MIGYKIDCDSEEHSGVYLKKDTIDLVESIGKSLNGRSGWMGTYSYISYNKTYIDINEEPKSHKFDNSVLFKGNWYTDQKKLIKDIEGLNDYVKEANVLAR